MLSKRAAEAIAGTIGYPSKMPGTSYGIPAVACKLGAILARIKGSVCHDCYALAGNYQYPSVKIAQEKRLVGILNQEWTSAMVALLIKAHKIGKGRNGTFAKGWHRWHDSGDIQSVEHLAKICDVAKATPKIRHWLPTRELAMAKAYIAGGGEVPTNLVIRVSATMIDGAATAQWPTTSRVHDEKAPTGYVCPAPKQNGKCGKCRACWNPDVPQTTYAKH